MICGYQMDQDGTLCMQAAGHETRGVPHLRYGEGKDYWDKQRGSDPNGEGAVPKTATA